MGALYASHYLWAYFAFQVIAGVLLPGQPLRTVGVAILAPVLVNILTFHGLRPLAASAGPFVALLWIVMFIEVATGVFRVVSVALSAAGLSPGERS